MWKNTEQAYGIISKLLHWFSAITVFAMFALGYWMVDLSYYSQWYQTAPHWHESVGVLLLFVTIVRLFWRQISQQPAPIASHSAKVIRSSKLVHTAIYVLLLALMVSGYLISTADERSIAVFNWFSVMGFGELIENQEDIAGDIHYYLAYGLIGLSLLHGLAAFKHHLFDKDQTLLRMLK